MCPPRETGIDRSLIGQEISCVRFPIERGKVAELAAALWDREAPWRAPDCAEASAAPDPPLPLTVTVLADTWREDGALAHAIALGADIGRLLHGETSWDYYIPLEVGDEVTARTSVTDITKRAGRRGGSMTFIRLETTYENGAGDLAARRSDLLIETAATGT